MFPAGYCTMPRQGFHCGAPHRRPFQSAEAILLVYFDPRQWNRETAVLPEVVHKLVKLCERLRASWCPYAQLSHCLRDPADVAFVECEKPSTDPPA